ncbi:heavy metal translocating P-type ATPase [Sulfurimonas sp. HSL-3221]|uniref:heavy metal translocating P-type ATPase n=1 Tax=Sulfurimonadaceae TaxID=2771471 RepID=UPI001E4F29A4|nr:heavy metal translocating P-type ATPase [Sulfurimonas sp. HSL-3221]UFS63079.1 heavy metal translocating P-type ATPase [Sulfurimonas sp. HSL-3221]
MSNVKCDHCHLQFDESVMIKEGDLHFCCKGCQGIYHLLKDEGLERFYDKLGEETLVPPTEQFEDSGNFNSPAFYDRYVKTDSEGFSEVSLIIEGIHCSACVWLNEKALHKMEGVVEAHINHTNNKARIVWDDEVVKLSNIIDMIRAIGYDAFPYDPQIQEARAEKERKDYYLRIAVAVFAMMNIMTIAVAQYAGFFTGMTQGIKNILNVAEWILSTPVLFYSGWVFFRGAYYGIRTRSVNMDILVATGASLTYLYSIYITLFELGEAYFDSVTMIITFVLVGKFLEVLSKKSAADTLDVLSKHVPGEVTLLKDGTQVNVSVNEVVVGDVILLKAGEKAGIDGEILSGEGSFDESSLTGESDPIYKRPGDSVVSGTTSIDAVVQYEATKDFEHSTLSNILTMLERSMAKKPRIEQLANRLSEYFSTVILLLAFGTFLVWWFWPHPFNIAFMVGISVIVIACPCALALATPVATLVGLGQGAKRGILFKEAAQLETLAQTDTLVLDKTGTITEGRPQVVDVQWYAAEAELQRYRLKLQALLNASKHPVAIGVSEYLSGETELTALPILDEVRQIAAKGMVARCEEQMLSGGNAALMRDQGIAPTDESAHTLFYFAVGETLVARFELADKPRPDAAEAIRALTHAGIDVIMLTGDHERSARKVAAAVGIEHYHAELTPEAKAALVAQMQSEGHKVVMAGDGVNDILALAQAEIGIAMGNGSDIAIDVSDVVLMNDSLTSLEEAFRIGRATYGLVKQNLGLSLVYNAVTVPLAMAGYIIPLVAAISMSLSSLLVVGNSMRIAYSWKRAAKRR